MPENHAAYLEAPKQYPLVVREAPVPTPQPHELLVRVSALAINPVDWKFQKYDLFPLPYPLILGSDVSGTVVSIGSDVASKLAESDSSRSFNDGDRVLAHAVMLTTSKPENAGFQRYVAVPWNMCSKIPDGVSFEEASVIPLGLSTAAHGLFGEEYLNLELPRLEKRESLKNKGKVLIVWGGSSSVGLNVIQLARGAELEVIAIASKRNEALLKSVGAESVVDYNEDDVVTKITEAVKGRTVVGAYDAISEGETTKMLVEVIASGKINAENRFVVTVLGGPAEHADGKVKSDRVMAGSIQKSRVGESVYAFVEKALAKGVYKALPEPMVVGQGLDKIQEAMDVQMKGVSAKKVVVSL